MASLRELQYSFAAALRDAGAPCAVTPAANLDIYRHHGESQACNVLGVSFPVLKRRVGDDYFRQLVHHYRLAHPSRSGDLHWLGQEFAPFLRSHLAGGEYAWLADLARLEWLRELAAIARPVASVGAVALAAIPPDELEHLRFRLQPSLALHESCYPVFSVWTANQAQNAPPVDQSLGSEQGLVYACDDGVVVRRVDRPLFQFLAAVLAGRSLGEATTSTALDEAGLRHSLGFIFSAGLVRELVQRSNR
jgi:hypothetical protein